MARATAHKRNALIKKISPRNHSWMARNERRAPEKGKSVQDAIELSDDEYDDASAPAAVIRPATPVPALAAPDEDDDDEIVVIGRKQEIAFISMTWNHTPIDVDAVPLNQPLVAAGFRENPLALDMGREDRPVQLLDSDPEEVAPANDAATRQASDLAARQRHRDLLHAAQAAVNSSTRKRRSARRAPISPMSTDSDGNGHRLAQDDIDLDEPGPSRPNKRRRYHSSSMPASPALSRSVSPITGLFGPRTPSDSSSDVSSDKWESYHAGFDTIYEPEHMPTGSDIKKWNQKRNHFFKVKADGAHGADVEAEKLDSLRRKELGVIQEPLRPLPNPAASFFNRKGEWRAAPTFPWDEALDASFLSIRRTPNRVIDLSSMTSSFKHELRRSAALRSLRTVKELVGTAGAVWTVAQSRNGTVATATSVAGGEPTWRDARGEYTVDTYNKRGNLSTWKNNHEEEDDRRWVHDDVYRNTAEVRPLEGHAFREVPDARRALDGHAGQQEPDERISRRTHYASVFEVAFDPFADDILISASADGTVRKWDRSDASDVHACSRVWTYPKHPHHLLYHPTQNMFAVGCMDGQVYIHSGYDSNTTLALGGDEGVRQRQVSSMKWGCGRTAQLMYYALERSGSNLNDGEAYVSQYGSMHEKPLYRLKEVHGGGAVMATDTTGDLLAIVVGLPDNPARQTLFVYSPDTIVPQLQFEVQLPEFGKNAHPKSMSDEHHIMDVKFSPCSRYVAIARDNNCGLIYDIRNNRKPVTVFSHITYSQDILEDRFAFQGGDKATYGIANVGWMGHDVLVTGGADGCIRRWKTGVATKDIGGEAIARLDQPVAHVSFGDDSLGHRYPIIAGDMEGKVYVFDYKMGFSGGFFG